ncbi:MAG: sodium-dependent bicarbonate transport family permease, partial [Synechococcus sp.]
MDTALVLRNLLSPAILFFFLGVFAVLLGSDLEIPAPLPKLFSLYL